MKKTAYMLRQEKWIKVAQESKKWCAMNPQEIREEVLKLYKLAPEGWSQMECLRYLMISALEER